MIEIRNRPLLDTLVDSNLFVAPDEMRRIEAGLWQGLNTILFGDRGVGKTTVLRQLGRRLRERERAAVFVNADHAENAGEVLGAVREALADSPAVDAKLRAKAAQQAGESAADLARTLVVDDTEKFVVLLDGAGAEAGHELFGRLRDLLWQAPLTWVVAARDDERGIVAPPADAFFERQVQLEPMSAGLIASMLTLRLADIANGLPIDELAAASAGNPRRALELAREVIVDHRTLPSILEDRAIRETYASTLGRAPSMLLTEIEQLDRPVWSSDEELLRRMGWTRNRAVQVLGALEAADLLTSYLGRGPRGGQVKMFAINRSWSAP